jgi:hypothetical protein
MIEALNRIGKASRFVYPVVEKYKKTIIEQIDKTIADAIIKGNENLKRKIS